MSAYQIPFDANGNQLSYDEWLSAPMDNFEFEDELTFVNYGKGRSSVSFIMRRTSNQKTVSMFISDFTDILPLLVHGVITGKFTFTKRGSNYGCKRITP